MAGVKGKSGSKKGRIVDWNVGRKATGKVRNINLNISCRAEEKEYLSGIPHRKNVSVRTWYRRETGTGRGVVFQGGSKGT